MQISWHCDRATWEHVVAQCPEATFFHSPCWLDVFAAADPSRRRSAALLASWPDGRQALLPFGVHRLWRGLVRAAISGTDRGYGGIIANGPLTDAEQVAIYAAFHRRFPECRVVANPLAAAPLAGQGFRQVEGGPARVIRLASLDTLRQGYNRERTRAVRRYQEKGVTVRMVRDPGEAELSIFYRLYQLEVASWADHGRSLRFVLSEAWFRRFWRLGRGQLRLAIATLDGEAAGAELVADQGRQATGLFLVWDRRFDAARVSTALTEACLADSHARGMSHWDFMDSGPITGLEHFKASFGAAAHPVWELKHVARTSRALMQVTHAVQRLRTWPQALPQRDPLLAPAIPS